MVCLPDLTNFIAIFFLEESYLVCFVITALSHIVSVCEYGSYCVKKKKPHIQSYSIRTLWLEIIQPNYYSLWIRFKLKIYHLPIPNVFTMGKARKGPGLKTLGRDQAGQLITLSSSGLAWARADSPCSALEQWTKALVITCTTALDLSLKFFSLAA